MTGNVYLIEMETTGYFKIGITRNNPVLRLGELQVGCPLTLNLVEWFNQEKPLVVEQHLHRVLSSLCVRGEWFFGDRESIRTAFVCHNCTFLVDKNNGVDSFPQRAPAAHRPRTAVGAERTPASEIERLLPEALRRYHLNGNKKQAAIFDVYGVSQGRKYMEISALFGAMLTSVAE